MKTCMLSFLFSLAIACQLVAQQNTASSARFVESEKLFNGVPTFPVADGWVNDYESVLREDEQAELEALLTTLEAETGHEIVLVLVDNFRPYQDVSEYATALGNEWGIGKTDQNNGVIFLVSLNKKVIRIATGTGLQASLSDQFCQEVINNQIIPKFKNQNIFGGIKIGLEAIATKLRTISASE